jgi:hypothetical protein
MMAFKIYAGDMIKTPVKMLFACIKMYNYLSFYGGQIIK